MVKPLEDIRIVSLEQYGAGPFGTLHLADLGAEVIKIEDPAEGGDVGRHVPPHAEGGDSLFFEAFNRNKRSLALDLGTAAGRGVFEELVAVSDVVYSNLRGDVPAKLRICYEDLRGVNERIVCCSLSGFGMTGPQAGEPGYDYVLQALAGWMALTGEPDGPPAKSALSLVDYSGGLAAGISLLAAVHAARRDGHGMDCDVSLYDTAIGMLTYLATWNLNGGFEPVRTRHSAHPSIVPFQSFQTKDGWMVVCCPKEKFWRRFAEVVGPSGLAEDPRFADFASRREHAGELLATIEPRLRDRTTAEWTAALRAAAVPCGEVRGVPDALADPHTIARGLVIETEHPRFGSVRQVASPVRAGPARTDHRRAPRLNEDAEYVLGQLLGYGTEQRSALAAGGAFG
ncbi:MAG TPA: CoA transferase [Acidimicrobiales bacterium]|nr:CoA transferase [Acidimicrobiales bacterium]